MKELFVRKGGTEFEIFLVDDDIYEDVKDLDWRYVKGQAITSWKGKKAMTLHRFVMTMEQDITGKVVKFKDGNFRNCQSSNLYVTEKYSEKKSLLRKIKELQERKNLGEQIDFEKELSNIIK